MDTKLPAGLQLQSKLGDPILVNEHLGEGGQGDVYSVTYLGEKKALKWYKPIGLGKKPQTFYSHLEENVAKGSLSREFLWPLAVTEWKDGTFGYIMDLRPEGYYEISEYMLTHVRFSSYRTIIDASLHIVSAFRLLHNAGYSYQDLNDGNFFINPKNGRVLICDNDNVAPDKRETGILGKPRYMAPEIVLGKNMPDTLSDRFSMAVILFILFCLNHPLEGKRSLTPCLSPTLQDKLYGSEASFMMEPGTREGPNGPDEKIHRNAIMVWDALPAYVQKLFIKALGHEALTKPNTRPSELEWIDCLVRFRSEIVPCPCGSEIFTQGGKTCQCESCGKTFLLPFRFELPDYSIPATAGCRLHRCQTGIVDADTALKTVGRVIVENNRLRLKNMSGHTWNVVTPSGKSKKVADQELVPLKDGIEIQIHDAKITIRENTPT